LDKFITKGGMMAETQRDSERKGVASFKAGSESAGAADEEQQVLVTINAGRVVKVEKVDKSGKRQELAEEDLAKLAGEDELEEIESSLEESFEAGVAVALGEEYDVDEAYEDEEEKSVRRLLLGGLLRRKVRQRILQRMVVGRLLHGASSKVAASSKAKNIPAQKGA
jgi:hypothetical protein